MKKLLLLIGIILLLSCEKQEICKTCTTVTTFPDGGISISTFQACGEDINKYDGLVDLSFDFDKRTTLIITTCK